MTSSNSPLLEVRQLTKDYGENRVLTNCRLEIRAGEIHALLGGNGAGKSTLVRIIAGLVAATSGEMQWLGNRYLPGNKREAEAAGIEIVQQEFNLIPTLSVAENLLLTRLPARGGWINRRELQRRAEAALKRLDLLHIPSTALVESLGVGQQQMIEIAAALDRQCKLLILDEPTAALSAAESETLFHWLKCLRESGVGIVYISHRLDEVSRLSDRITVLQDGKTLGTYATNQLTIDQMVSLMTSDNLLRSGDSVATEFPKQTESTAAPQQKMSGVALRVENLSGGIVAGVSFSVQQGERLGIAGLIGSGRTELLRLIFGADTATSGAVYLFEEATAHRFRHPREAVAAGLAMITEDRKQNGLLLTQSIRVNSTLTALQKQFSRWGLIRRAAEQESARRHCQTMETRCTSIEQPAGTLSGGNQQKVVIARWLTSDARIFLFDEPTRGIDVPARKRIYRLMETLAEAGKSLVIVSSDLEELFETCDRIAVMSNGKMVQIFSRENWSHDEIMQASFAGYRSRSVHS